MYYWFSTLVAIPYLFDSITGFVSYILSHLHLCFRTQLFLLLPLRSLAFSFGQNIGYHLFLFKEFEIP